MNHYDRVIASSEIGRLFEWDRWCREIPKIKFKRTWDVQVIPPFAGAVVRFVVSKGKARVSVYLDCYDNLGYFGEPHWEIYPDSEDTNARFAMNDTETLLKEIDKSLKAQAR
jgi:hypothetical protein